MNIIFEKELLDALNYINLGYEDIKTPTLHHYKKGQIFKENEIYIGSLNMKNNIFCTKWSFPYKNINPTTLNYYDLHIKNKLDLIEINNKKLFCDCGNLTECHGNLLIFNFNLKFLEN